MTTAESAGWIGVDLDGTLAEYHGWPKDGGVGQPIPLMVDRVKAWLEAKRAVKIFTARVCPQRDAVALAQQHTVIRAWCLQHLGVELEVTATKDFHMIVLYDDRCVQVETNTGFIVKGGRDAD